MDNDLKKNLILYVIQKGETRTDIQDHSNFIDICLESGRVVVLVVGHNKANDPEFITQMQSNYTRQFDVWTVKDVELTSEQIERLQLMFHTLRCNNIKSEIDH